MIQNKYNIKILLPSFYAAAKAIVYHIDYNKNNRVQPYCCPFGPCGPH